MKITFHGAVQTVTGSQHLLEVNGNRILLDCGLYQGKRSIARDRNRNLPFEPSDIDVMVLSHAHIDHAGNIPNLTKERFDADIYCTSATRDLSAYMLRDSGHIQERDAEYVNKKHKRKGEPPVDPIYTEQDAIRALNYFMTVNYNRPREIATGVTMTMVDAGHMLGSAIVILDIEDREEKRDFRLAFSGDLGRTGAAILRDCTQIEGADYLIMESTYGGRNHDNDADAKQQFRRVINETYKRGGKVIIPAFSVGRTQQVVYMLNQLYHEHKIPDIPVFVDSPLAVNATSVFRLHPEAYDEEAALYMSQEDPDGDLFGFGRLQYVRRVEQSKAINFLREPCVIISASGMMEHGRILHHLKNNIEDDRNTVLVTGWQAPNTLGRYLVDGADKVRIFGEEYHSRINVEVMNGFSGHADHKGLVGWVDGMTRKPREIFLVHGEPDAAAALADDLKASQRIPQVHVPQLHQEFHV